MKAGNFVKAKELIQLQGFNFFNRDFIAKDEVIKIGGEVQANQFRIITTINHYNDNPIIIDKYTLENKFEICDKPII
jgi:hypothetical protein